jgi:uncharacterized membrane protein
LNERLNTEPVIAWVGQATTYLAVGVEASAALIVTIAAIQAVIRSLGLVLHPTDETAKEDIRLSFGRWLALALEFELAADILRTTIAPNWNEIGQLAAIVVLRTALNFFLQKEIESADARNRAKAQSEASTS